MSKELTDAQVEKILTTDARRKSFKKKLLKLGYVKKQAGQVNKIMEKIADFGMARFIPQPVAHAKLSPKVMTLWYRAPEMLLGRNHRLIVVGSWSSWDVPASLDLTLLCFFFLFFFFSYSPILPVRCKDLRNFFGHLVVGMYLC